MTNFYTSLNVAPDVDAAAIKEALKRELRLWTNRTNAPGLERRQEAERMVKLLEEAEEILLDPERRSRYDRELATVAPAERQIDETELREKEDLVAEGWRLLIAGHVADALYVGTKATEREGSNADAWALLAQARYRWGDVDDAIYEYKRAQKLRPNEATFYFDLGNVLESADRLPEALQQYERAARADPGSTMYRAAVGGLLVKQEQYDRAIETLQRCVDEEPDNATYQWFLALAYADRAYESWTFVAEGGDVPSGYYATQKAHVEEAREFVHKAQQLRFDDRDLETHIEEIRTNIEQMEERKFHGNRLAAIAAMVIGLLSFETIIGPLWFLGGGIAYLFAAKPPQYVLNRRIIAGRGATSADWVAQAGEGEGGCLSMCIGLFVISGFIPIMALYNYYVNYRKEA